MSETISEHIANSNDEEPEIDSVFLLEAPCFLLHSFEFFNDLIFREVGAEFHVLRDNATVHEVLLDFLTNFDS